MKVVESNIDQYTQGGYNATWCVMLGKICIILFIMVVSGRRAKGLFPSTNHNRPSHGIFKRRQKLEASSFDHQPIL